MRAERRGYFSRFFPLILSVLLVLTIWVFPLISAEDLYEVGSTISIDLEKYVPYALKITSPDETYFLEGEETPLYYKPSLSGTHTFEVEGNGESEIFIFEVGDSTVVSEEIEFSESEFSEENVDLIRIGERVKWNEKIYAEGSVQLKVPYGSEEINAYEIQGKTKIKLEATVEDESIIGNAIGGILGNEWDRESTIIIEEIDGEVEIEYTTPAPEKSERVISELEKEIEISSPDNVHYENVLSYTQIEELTSNKEKIQVFWEDEGRYMDFEAYDRDNDGLYDYIEWITPHLSTQTFQVIIEIEKAEHLDENRQFISNIYDFVKELDGIWSEIIPENHFVRVKFEKELNSNNDITVYPRITSGSPIIEVYEEGQSEVIATFDNLVSERKNQIYLSSLTQPQDSFDLRLVGGSAEFDLIIDPSITYVGAASDNTNNVNSMTINVTSIGIQDNDLILFFGSADGIGYNLPTGAGFTEIYDVNTAGTHNNILGYKIASSEPSTYTVATKSGGGERGIGIFAVYRGIDLNNPIDTNSSNIGGSDTTAILTGVTPSQENNTVVAFVGLESGNSGNPIATSWPAGITEVLDNVNGPPGNGGASSAGAFGHILVANTSTISGNIALTGGNTNWGAMAVVLNVDSVPPGVTINSPLSQNYSIGSVILNVTTSESASCNYTLNSGITNITMSTLDNVSFNATNSSIADGPYTAQYFCWDELGNLNDTEIVNFAIDTTPPTIIINSPTPDNVNYSVSNVLFNITLSESGINASYSLNNGITNVSMSSGDGLNFNATTSSIADGSYTVNFYASDTLGNPNNTEQRNFLIDTTAPLVNLIEPQNNTYNTDQLEINFTVFDETIGGIDSCWYILNGGLNITLSNCANASFTASQGSSTLQIFVNDTLGNLNNSQNVSFFVDSQEPVIEIVYPENGTAIGINTSISLNATITDLSELSTCWWGIDDGANQTITCGQNTTFDAVDGEHTIRYYANDTYGQLGSSLTTFTITTGGPVVTLITPINGFATNETFIEFNYTASDAQGVSMCTLYGDWNGDWHANKTTSSWWNSDWNARVTINISNVGSTDLSDFPVYLNISYDSDMQADYDDLRFVNGSCDDGQTTELDYEIGNYTNTNAHLWVNVGSLLSSGSQICMYYDNPSVSSGENPSGVWDSNYLAVYHFEETLDGTAGDLVDSAGSNDGTSFNMDSGDNFAGGLGNAYSFTSSNSEYLQLPDLADGQSELTVEYWVYNPSYNDGRAYSSGGTGTSQVLVWPDNTNGFDSIVDGDRANGGSVESYTGWNYHTMTYDGSLITNYENGQAAGTDPHSGTISDQGSVDYFARDSSGVYFNDEADEVRISNIARSDDWVNQTYQLVVDQAGLIAYSAESNYVPDLFNITINEGDGTYLWNVMCTDSLGLSEFAPSNFSFVIDTQFPEIEYVSTSFNTSDDTEDEFAFSGLPTNPQNSVDENFTTFAVIDSVSGIDILYMNYTKLSGSNSATLEYLVDWNLFSGTIQCFSGSGWTTITSMVDNIRTNVTVPSTCFNQENLQIRMYRSLVASTGIINVYEEKIYWNTIPLTEIDGANLSRSFITTNVIVNETNEENITFTLSNAGGIVNQTTFTSQTRIINWTGLADGTYQYNVTVADIIGRQNFTETRTITLDSNAPNGTLISPTNGSYVNNNQQNLTVNASDGVGLDNATLFIYNESGDLVNQTIVEVSGTEALIGIVYTFLTDGIFTWFYSLFDTSGNEFTTENNTLIIDTTFAAIQFVNPTQPNGTLIEQQFIEVNVTVDEINEANITFRLYNSSGLVNETFYDTEVRTIIWYNLTNSNTTYYYNVSVDDLAGNTNTSITRTITLTDETPPALVLVRPQNVSYSSNTSLALDFTVSDLNLANCWYSLNGGANTSLPGCSNITFDVADFSSHEIILYANDTVGLLNFTSVSFFTNTSLIFTNDWKVIRDVASINTLNDVALSDPIDPTKSFLIHSVRDGDSGPDAIQVTGSILNSETLRFENYGGATVDVEWELITGPNLSVQRGEETYGATQELINVDLDTPVNLQESFVTVTNRLDDTTNGQNDEGFFSGRFVNSTRIALERDVANAVGDVSWQVVEWDGASVQAGNFSTTAASGSDILTTPVNLNNSFLIFSRRVTDGGLDDTTVGGFLANSSGIDFYRVTGAGTISIDWYVVEWDHLSVQRGNLNVAGSTTITQNINELTNVSRSFTRGYWSSTGGGTSFANTMVSHNITDNSTISFQKGTGSQTNNLSWQVIEIIELQTPVINLTYPQNDSSFNTTTISQFNYSVNDSSQILSCSLYGDWSGSWQLNQTDNNPLIGVNSFLGINVEGDGNYNWNVECTDLYGNVGVAESNNTFFIDSTFPTIDYGLNTLNSSINISQNSIFVNVTVNETNEANITFSLYNSSNDLINESIFTNGQRTINFTGLTDGNYSFNVTVVDVVNNVNSTETRTLTIDITNPNGTLVSPEDGDYTNISSQNLTANISDNFEIDNATLFVYNESGDLINQTTVEVSGTEALIGVVYDFLTDGIFTWFYSIFDFAGNEFITENNTIIIDTTNSNIVFGIGTEPNGQNFTRDWVYINVSVEEINEANISFELYDAANTLVNQSIFTDSQRTINFTGLSDGFYYYNVTVTDLAGNFNFTETRIIGLDNTGPNIEFLVPTEDKAFGMNTSIPLNVSVNDVTTSVDSCWWSLDGGPNQSIICGQNTTFDALDGTHDIIFYSNDSLGTLSFAGVNFSVSTLGPAISLVSPADNAFLTEVNVTFNYTATDPQGVSFCSLYGSWAGGWHLNQSGLSWWENNWSKRQEFNITNAGGAELDDFPMYLNITFDSDMQADYEDLRFINGSCGSGGSLELDYEIENYTSTKADVWLRMPTLPSSGASVCMYYDNPSASSGENPSGVWDTNFTMVHHLIGDDLDGGSGDIKDSLGQVNGTTSGSPSQAEGQVDGSISLSTSGGNDYIDFGDVDEIDDATQLTFEAWVQFSTTTSDDDIWAKGLHSLGNPLLIWRDDSVGSGDQAGNTDALSVFIDDGPDTRWISSSSGSLGDTDWHHVVVTFRADNLTGLNIYIDGELEQDGSTINVDGLEANTNSLIVGADTSGSNSQGMDGIIDEMRISDIVRSADWINQTYQMVANQGSIVLAGSEEEQTNDLFMVNITDGDGNYTWNVQCTDGIGLTSFAPENYTFTIDTLFPTIDYGVGTEVDGANFSRDWIYVNVSAFDGNEANITFTLLNSTDVVNETTFDSGVRSVNFTGLPNEAYRYFVTITDLSSKQNTTEIRNIGLDTVPPNIVIDQPLDIFYPYDNLSLNYSVYDSFVIVDSCWYSLNGGPNITLSSCENSTIIGAQGNNTVIVYANDTLGNANITVNRSFFVDSSPPLIDYGILTEDDNATVNVNWIFVNVTVVEAVESNITFRFFNESNDLQNESFFNTTIRTINWTNLSDGVYYYNVTAVDSASNINTTLTRSIRIDTVLPNGTLISPDDDDLTSDVSQNLTVNASDNIQLDNATLFVYNESGDLVNQTTVDTTGTEAVIGVVYTFLTDGIFTWFYSLFDIAGNEFTTENNTITIDTTPSTIVFISPTESNGTEIEQSNIYVNVSVTEPNFANITFRLYNDLGLVNETSYNLSSNVTNFFEFNWTGLPSNNITYSYNVSVTDQVNLSNFSETRYITLIDTTSPTITIDNPQNVTYASNTSLVLDYIALDANLGDCWYSIDGSPNITLVDCVNTTFDVSDFTGHELIIYVNDSFGFEDFASVSFSVNTSLVFTNDWKVVRDYSTINGIADISLPDPIDPTKSFVMHTVRDALSGPNTLQVTADIINSETIRFENYAGGTADVEWELITGPNLSVQRGEVAFGTADQVTTVDLEIPVNLSESFVVISSRMNIGSSDQNDEAFFTGRFINETRIEIDRDVTGSAGNVSWQVVEWDDANVQSGTFSTTAATGTDTLANPVVPGNSFLIFSKRVTDGGLDDTTVGGFLTNSTDIDFYRVTGAGTITMEWFVVEWDHLRTERGSVNVAVSTAVTQSINTLTNTTRTFLRGSWSSTGGGTTFANALITYNLTDENTISIQKGTGAQTNNLSWQVIEIIELQPPVINLTNPSNNSAFNVLTIDEFNYTVNDSSTLLTCRLFGNWSGSWQVNQTDSSPQIGENSFSGITLNQDGKYIWNVECTDLYGNLGYSSGNNTFIIDRTPPSITQVSINETAACALVQANCTVIGGIAPVDSVWIEAISPTGSSTNYTAVNLTLDTYFANVSLGEQGNWSFTCHTNDTATNNANFNYSGSLYGEPVDIEMISSNIQFEYTQPVENTITGINATIINNQCGDSGNFTVSFYDGSPLVDGEQINGNITTSVSGDSSATVSVNWTAVIGPLEVFVQTDIDDVVIEENETNNDANNTLNVGAWQDFYGDVTVDKLLGDYNTTNLTAWANGTILTGNIFVTDSEADISWISLLEIGKNTTGGNTTDDYSEIDTILNMSTYEDSVANSFTSDGVNPLTLRSTRVHKNILDEIPIINSTNTSSFVTGMLWDSSDDSNGEFDSGEREDLVFMAVVNDSTQGFYGVYDYEITVPVRLRSYDETDNTDVFFYFDIE